LDSYSSSSSLRSSHRFDSGSFVTGNDGVTGSVSKILEKTKRDLEKAQTLKKLMKVERKMSELSISNVPNDSEEDDEIVNNSYLTSKKMDSNRINIKPDRHDKITKAFENDRFMAYTK